VNFGALRAPNYTNGNFAGGAAVLYPLPVVGTGDIAKQKET
jgi:hypothetical protein